MASVTQTEPRGVPPVLLPSAVGVGGAAGLALLRLHDPHAPGSYGYCPFLLVTGHPCPGCGTLRAGNDLMHGDVLGALGSNAFSVVLGVILAAYWGVWMVRAIRHRPAPRVSIGPRGQVAIVALYAAFGVFHNTPWGAGLAP